MSKKFKTQSVGSLQRPEPHRTAAKASWFSWVWGEGKAFPDLDVMGVLMELGEPLRPLSVPFQTSPSMLTRAAKAT